MQLVDEAGRSSVGYKFTLHTSTPAKSRHSDAEFYNPDDDDGVLYAGEYTFFVNATAGGTPLNLTFRGHNGFLVNSHIDDYRIVYKHFYPRPDGIDESMFMPPLGMPCRPFTNPIGPWARQQPLRDFAMAMPGPSGDRHRHEVVSQLRKQSNADSKDWSQRQELALKHFRYIQAANRRGLAYSLGVNHLVTWTDLERKALLGRKPIRLIESYDLCKIFDPPNVINASKKLPMAVDWSSSGLVTPVKDQGVCGSCWAFGTIGTIEGQVARLKGHQVILSEQHLVDCSWDFENLGCDGGEAAAALSWLLSNNKGEAAIAKTYGPYLSQDGFCHFDASKNIHVSPLTSEKVESVTIKSCWHVGPVEFKPDYRIAVPRLRFALAETGPISVAISASNPDFYYYAGGIYDDPTCGSSMAESDHIVLLVGYGHGKTSGKAYWKIKNSWSTHWGEAGFGRIAQQDNICGVATAPVFAKLD